MSAPTPDTQHTPRIDRPGELSAFRPIKRLVGAYLGISALTLVAIVVLRHHSAEVNSAVWTRAIIVLASALLTLSFTVHAARGARRSFLRLRIVSIVMPIAIVVIIALPGMFPLWMKIEQAVCGVLLIAVAALAHRGDMRSSFAPEQ